MRVVVEAVIAEGDKVVVRFSLRGTHQLELMGSPPTGKQVSWTGIGIYRIEDDKIVEAWAGIDNLGLLQQLGCSNSSAGVVLFKSCAGRL